MQTILASNLKPNEFHNLKKCYKASQLQNSNQRRNLYDYVQSLKVFSEKQLPPKIRSLLKTNYKQRRYFR